MTKTLSSPMALEGIDSKLLSPVLETPHLVVPCKCRPLLTIGKNILPQLYDFRDCN